MSRICVSLVLFHNKDKSYAENKDSWSLKCSKKKTFSFKSLIDLQLLSKFHLNVSDVKTNNKTSENLIGSNFLFFLPFKHTVVINDFGQLFCLLAKVHVTSICVIFFDESIQLIIIIVQITKMPKLIHLSFYAHPNNRQFLELFICRKTFSNRLSHLLTFNLIVYEITGEHFWANRHRGWSYIK